MRILLFLFVLLCSIATRASNTNAIVDVLIVVGAAGEKEYGKEFGEAAKDWTSAGRTASKSFHLIDPETAGTNELGELTRVLAIQNGTNHELWIIFIGHGTFDGKDAKFNLAGPDISAKDLSAKLQSIQREIILINSSSSSAPFMNELAAPSRIVVTATRSGYEENYSRFGRFFARSIVDPNADLDQDGQVSLLEAFLMASRQVEDFYKEEKRLATEHALLDDNGDGKGTPATFFSGVRPSKKPEEVALVDGFRAHQLHFLPNESEARLSPELRKKRNDLEFTLEQLRNRKVEIPEAKYMEELEKIVLEISRLYHEADKR